MKKNILVNIVEKNIDGCGSDASALIKLELPDDGRDANEIVAVLKETLVQIKKNSIEDDVCLDTDDMIHQALDTLNLTAEYISYYGFEF